MMILFPTIDIPTLYTADNTIFDDFVFPDLIAQDGTRSSMSDDEKSNLIDEILMETEGLEPIYTRPSILKNRIQIFTRLNKPNWERYARTESFIGSYNPTENVFEESEEDNIESRVGDNTDTETRGLETIKASSNIEDREDVETKDLDGFTKHNGASFEGANGFDDTTSGSISVGGTDEGSGSLSGSVNVEKASADGSKDDYEDNGTDTHVIEGSGSEAETINEGGSIENVGESTEANVTNHTTNRHGNIGVSTSASIMREEFELVTMANLHKQIIKDFVRKFCIRVY